MKKIDEHLTHKISDDLKKKWKTKAATIRKAQIAKMISLSTWEIGLLSLVERAIKENKDLSFAQSSALSRIYDRI